jgi:hypothetical protein
LDPGALEQLQHLHDVDWAAVGKWAAYGSTIKANDRKCAAVRGFMLQLLWNRAAEVDSQFSASPAIGRDVDGDKWCEPLNQAVILGYSLDACGRLDQDSILRLKSLAVALLGSGASH